jgi:uncharacterized membrane-anchored protein YhcB (DUF1043 family)
MEMEDILNPSTTMGALVIGVIAGIISGIFLGFFTGKVYERKRITKTMNKLNIKGNRNQTNITNH